MKKVFSFVVLMLITVILFACSSEPDGFRLTVEKVGEGEITITPQQNFYEKDAEVEITATPNTGWKFSQWEGDLTGSENPVSIKMDADKTITAKFAKAVTLTINTEGSGSVVVDPKKDVYCEGDAVTLKAMHGSNISTFVKWEGGTINNSTNAIENIVLEGDTTIKAIFGLSDKVSFYEDFEQNNGTWSTKYTYELAPADSADKKPLVQQTTICNGDWSAKFGGISDREVSSFETTVNVEKDSYVSFSYKVSSESYDKFYFYVDDDAKFYEKGDVDWTKYEGELSSGEHTLKWSYEKDISGGSGEDTAWIDDIVIRDVVPKHMLTVSTTGHGRVIKKVYGEVSEISVYEEGTQITLEAVPGTGESFTTWGGADAPTGNLTDSTLDIVMGTSDMSINASFTGTHPVIDWLIMMYMDGDCNLEAALWADLNEVEYGLHGLDEDVRSKIKIVALWDGIPEEDDLPPEGARLYELGPDPEYDGVISDNTEDLTATRWWSGDEVDMSDGDNLKAFLKWAKSRYHGYTYSVLTMSDHGGGPRNRDGKPRGRGVIWDDTTGEGHFLETKELSQAISGAGFTGENKLSILGFDACLMASVEEAYEHRNVADYYVASLQLEQGNGWQYHHWIPQLTEVMTPAELGTILVKSYHESFDSLYSADQTLSCTDLSKMDDLKTAIDALGKAINDNNLVSDCKGYFEDSIHSGGTWATLYEVGDFVSKLSSTAVATEANAVANVMKEAIVYSWADTLSGDYYGPGSVTGKGLHLMGKKDDDIPPGQDFPYGIGIFSFADGDWATLYNEWY